MALAVVEFLDRADQPQIPLLDKVEEAHAVGVVPLGDGNYQPQVGFRKLVLGADVASLDAFGQGDFLLGGQQLDAADLLEIHPHRIGGGNVHRKV